MTILKESDLNIRDSVFDYAKFLTPDAIILDVGGASGPWSIATHIADIQEGQSFVGDICRMDVWDKIRKFSANWDLVLCTHTLEDIRDPGFVIDQINSICKTGFIAIPHKHSELGRIDSDYYVGYCHHRWVFTFQENKLRIAAKWPVTSRLAARSDVGPDFLGWLDRSRSQYPGKPTTEELAVLWEGQLDWEYIRGDWAGRPEDGCDGMLRMYRDEFAGGI